MSLRIIFILATLIVGSFNSPVEFGDAVKHISEFPFVVHLRILKLDRTLNRVSDFGCGGTLLKPDIVITAGHCLLNKGYIIDRVEVTAGSIYSNNEDDEIKKRLAKGFRIHKDFVRKQENLLIGKRLFPYDIAIVWLNRPFAVESNTKIQPAVILNSDLKPGMIGDFVGWGQLETGYPAKSLRRGKLRKISDTECKRKYYYNNGPNTYCVLSLDLKCGISIGDSGGPFIYQGSFAGIVSYGGSKSVKEKRRDVACDTTKPVVLTDIRMYSKWINANLKIGAPKTMCLKDQQKYCAL